MVHMPGCRVRMVNLTTFILSIIWVWTKLSVGGWGEGKSLHSYLRGDRRKVNNFQGKKGLHFTASTSGPTWNTGFIWTGEPQAPSTSFIYAATWSIMRPLKLLPPLGDQARCINWWLAFRVFSILKESCFVVVTQRGGYWWRTRSK